MIKHVVIHPKVLQPRLFVNLRKELFPRDTRLLRRIQVDPDEAKLVYVDVDLEETVLRLIEGRELLILGRLGQLAVETI